MTALASFEKTLRLDWRFSIRTSRMKQIRPRPSLGEFRSTALIPIRDHVDNRPGLDEHLPESIETTLARPKPRQRCYVFAVLDLFEHATDFGELAAEFGAQVGQNRDERDCDQRSDQRVFDSGGARLVADERPEGLDHFLLLLQKWSSIRPCIVRRLEWGTDYRPSRFPEVNSILRSPAIPGGISTWLNSA
jgi:hypothetical protein